jgi:hypothetical protein
MADAAAGPEHDLARALLRALRDDFREREVTALQLAELLLDAAEDALPLVEGAEAGPALERLELLATRADLYAWDGPPGWDEVLKRGLSESRRAFAPGASPLDGLGAPPTREAQRRLVEVRAREEARNLLALGRRAAHPEEAAASSAAGVVAAAHASLLRLLALASVHALLTAAEDPKAGSLPPASVEALVREMDERAASGSDFAGAHEEWLARLAASNEAASLPGFRTFFAGLSQSLRLAVALRRWRDEARAGTRPAELEALVGAAGAWQPLRWAQLRRGVPAAWLAELCPPEPAEPDPLARLARECEAALEIASRLWVAQGLSPTGFSSLATLLFARSACALALREEL